MAETALLFLDAQVTRNRVWHRATKRVYGTLQGLQSFRQRGSRLLAMGKELEGR